MAETANGQWGYPLEETNGNARPPAKRGDTYGSHESGQSGKAKSARRTPSEAYNIMSDSEETKQRRAYTKAGNTAATRRRPTNGARDKGNEAREEVFEDSAWIHRDKLAQIEIQEMADAGIDVRQARRSMSTGPDASARSSRSVSRSRRPISDDPPDEPLPATTRPEETDFNPYVDTEFRTPEEVAAEQESFRSHMIRPSTSRIPISKASPVPVPSDVIDRDSPLPRSQNGNGGWSGNWDDMQYARRARSTSMGSQAVLDEDGARTPSRQGSSYVRTSNDNSPPKARVPSKTTPKIAPRKGSTANSVADRPPSSLGKDGKAPTPKERPASRGGPNSVASPRPSTSHRAPEGEAPWITSMYKPDPRLPPDQQMLPTHAKRMMQEQWEKEGKTGTVYDRELNPLNDTQFPVQPTKPLPKEPTLDQAGEDRADPYNKPMPDPPSPPSVTPHSSNMSTWPLPTKSDRRSDPPAPSRPSTSGGLRLTPAIVAPPSIENASVTSVRPMPRPVPRMPEMDEKEVVEAKKGCACCVVM